jgi:hypothetical protein
LLFKHVFQDGEWTVGIWKVKEYIELPHGSSESLEVEKGSTVQPVLVVVDAPCREVLKEHAAELLTYAAGASPKNFGKLVETSDSENPMNELRYEGGLEARQQRALGVTLGKRPSAAVGGNKPVVTHVNKRTRALLKLRS